MQLRNLILCATVVVTLGSGCLLTPEHGEWIDSIFDDITFNVTSLTEGGGYVIETAELDLDGNLVAWHFLTTGTTDAKLMTDSEGRDIYVDTQSIAALIGWYPAAGPGCGNIDPKCHYKVRIRARVETPFGNLIPAYTYDDGSLGCQADAIGQGADQVITDCARSEQWVEIYAHGD